jgi:hypothetical protein
MKVLKIVLLQFFCICMFTGKAQIIFQKTFNNPTAQIRFSGIELTPDSGYIMSGNSYSTNQSPKGRPLLAKYDMAGNLIWSKEYLMYQGGSSVNIIVLDSSSFLMYGRCDLDSNSLDDFFLLLVDSAGDILWFNGMSSNINCSIKECMSTSGGFLVVTSEEINDHINVVFKFDLSGNLLWQRTILASPFIEINAISAGPGSSIFLSGLVMDSVLTYKRYCFIMNLDSSGNFNWSKYYYIDTAVYQNITLTKSDLNGNLYAMGDYVYSNNDSHPFIFKTDSTGNIILLYSFDNFNNYFADAFCLDEGNSVALLCGSTALIAVDSNGTIAWNKRYIVQSGNFGLTKVKKARDNGFILAGSSGLIQDPSGYFIKTDSSGDAGCYQQNINFSISNPGINSVVLSAPTDTLIPFSFYYICSANPLSILDSTWCKTGTPVNEIKPEGDYPLVFPNPVEDMLFVDPGPSNLVMEIELFSSRGERVGIKDQFDKKSNILNLSFLKSGLYILQISSSHSVYRKKIIKI